MTNELLATIRLQIAEHDVKRLQLWFTDVLGDLEMVEIDDGDFARVFEHGMLDAEALGLRDNAAADIVAVPHWSTFKIARLPHDHEKTAHVFCSLNSLGFGAYDAPKDAALREVTPLTA